MALLRDGRVLIVNGSPEGGAERSAMIYDPVADRFETVGAPPGPETWPFLVTLPDGRVLVGGGEATTRWRLPSCSTRRPGRSRQGAR